MPLPDCAYTTDIEDTFSAYSSLVTQYDNANYETSLSAANKIYAPTRKVVDVREPKEAELVSSFLESQSRN